jgi:hypothetical protein
VPNALAVNTALYSNRSDGPYGLPLLLFESPESPIAIGAESANRSDPGWWAPEEDDEDSLADANRQMDAFAVDSAFEQLLDDDLAGDIATAWGQELGAQGLLAALV